MNTTGCIDAEQAMLSVQTYLQACQDNFCVQLAAQDGVGHFIKDAWEQPSRGGGCTCVMRDGTVFEQIGVAFSRVSGPVLPVIATQKHPDLEGYAFMAQGLSVIAHPYNPYVPTAHMNLRFFVAHKASFPPVWWFGGGYDLTPYYGFEEDCYQWHRRAKAACDPWGENIYADFKAQCARYFYLPHRQEPRGIGGLFFDDLNRWGFESTFRFIQEVGHSFIQAYLSIVDRRQHHHYGQRERDFQQYRRGRYVEFNLIYDRGTLFGLQWGGRVESILMSLPPQVAWRYNWSPEPGTPERALYENFLVPRDWIGAEKSSDVPYLHEASTAQHDQDGVRKNG